MLVDAGDYATDFVPYGTPCGEQSDPGRQRIEILEARIEALVGRIDALAPIGDAGATAPRKRAGKRA